MSNQYLQQLTAVSSVLSGYVIPITDDPAGTGRLKKATVDQFKSWAFGNVSLTSVASGATITLLDGKTFTVNNTLTLSGNDGSSLNIGAGGTLAALAFKASVDLSSSDATGIMASGRMPAFTGDVTNTAGSLALSIGASKVTNAMLAGSIAASKLVGTDITTVGTITNGIWNGSGVAPGYGGTGLSTYTLGDILYASATNTLSKLTGNTTATRNFLRQVGNGSVSAAPAWDTVTKSDVGLGSVENTALSTWAGTANITTVGSIGTGTWNATAIGATKGGTGQTTWAQGDLLYANATNSLTKLTAGPSGQVLQSQGTTGNPRWVGAPVLISSQTAVSAATVDFTSGIDSSFKTYLVEWDGVKSSTNGNGLQLRVSQDGGATWKSGASDYAYSFAYFSSGATTITVQSSTATSSLNCAVAAIGSGINTSGAGSVKIFNPSDSAKFFMVETSSNVTNSATSVWRSTGTGNYTTAGAVNGIRFLMQSGNIVSGNFRLYGLM